MHQIQEFVGYPIEKLLDCDNKPENTDTAFFTYGRFQPGHRGHETMIMTMLAQAEAANTKTGTARGSSAAATGTGKMAAR